jgi:hypothetical protein
MEAVRQLRKLGLSVDVKRGVAAGSGERLEAVVELRAEGVESRFAVESRDRAPYPNELKRLDVTRGLISEYGQPLLVVPFVPVALGERLRTTGWSWADAEGNLGLRAKGVVISQRLTDSQREPRRTRRPPGGAGSSGTIRTLIGWPRDTPLPTVTDLAKKVGVSQPRMSQILTALRDLELTAKKGREWFVVDRAALLDRFADGFDQSSVSTRYLYSLDPVLAVAERAAILDEAVVVSADVGPDLVAPWRHPSVVVLYTHDWIEPDRLGAVEADGREAANIFVRQPPDEAVMGWATSVKLRADGPEIPLADPTQMLIDLLDLGGSDREEAAGLLRTWILDRP